jgi:hypothetical protein
VVLADIVLDVHGPARLDLGSVTLILKQAIRFGMCGSARKSAAPDDCLYTDPIDARIFDGIPASMCDTAPTTAI